GIVTAPLLCAMEEFPQLRAVIDQGLDNPANVDLSSLNAFQTDVYNSAQD
ncbi:solanesyl-diphosphate synthase 1, mitochondrial-like, partial [Fagus crenata]